MVMWAISGVLRETLLLPSLCLGVLDRLENLDGGRFPLERERLLGVLSAEGERARCRDPVPLFSWFWGVLEAWGFLKFSLGPVMWAPQA